MISHETYSLVRDLVMVEEQAPLAVKGFAKPVRSYKVAGIYDDLIGEGKVIRKKQDGLNVMVDLTKQDKLSAIQALEEVLAQLKD